jgi:hypothetical protein
MLESNHPHPYNFSFGVYMETGSFGEYETYYEGFENFLG